MFNKSRLAAFKLYCADLGVSPTDCPVEVVLNFLTILRRVFNYKYQTICGYRSAISKFHVGIDNAAVGECRPVRRLTRSCFIENPPLPRYTEVWDVDKLLTYLKSLAPQSDLTDLQLSVKTLSLLFVLSLSRSIKKFHWRFSMIIYFQVELSSFVGTYLSTGGRRISSSNFES